MSAALDARSPSHISAQQSDAVTSLLSLGEDVAPVPIRTPSSTSSTGSGALSTSVGSAPSSVAASVKHHRRLGSTGRTKRRLSDAREAGTRPILAASPPNLSLSALSLSASPKLAPRPSGISIAAATHSPVSIALSTDETPSAKPPKKRGIDYKCESCAKIYRHPNCLNKHRWEHTRQWREASKFVLSKHQQVQLLEAATILSFMGQVSTSLPEDRSEWPSFLSGGSLPKPDSFKDEPITTASTPKTTPIHPISASVPTGGPRMHDYSVSGRSTTQVVRPGLVGVPNQVLGHGRPARTAAVPPPAANAGTGIGGGGWSLPSSSIRSNSSRSRSNSSASEDIEIEADYGNVKPSSYSGTAAPHVYGDGPYGSSSYGAYPGYTSSGYGYAGYSNSTSNSHRRAPHGLVKREDDEMSGFSVREEDEDVDLEDEDVTTTTRKGERWNGMEMEVDMDMD